MAKVVMFRNQRELNKFLQGNAEEFVKGTTKQVAEQWQKIILKKLYNHRPPSEFYERLGSNGGFLSSITNSDASFNGKKWTASVGFDASKLDETSPRLKAKPPQFGAHTDMQGSSQASNMFLWQEFGYRVFSKRFKQGNKKIRGINTLPVIKQYIDRLMKTSGNLSSVFKYWDGAFNFSKK